MIFIVRLANCWYHDQVLCLLFIFILPKYLILLDFPIFCLWAHQMKFFQEWVVKFSFSQTVKQLIPFPSSILFEIVRLTMLIGIFFFENEGWKLFWYQAATASRLWCIKVSEKKLIIETLCLEICFTMSITELKLLCSFNLFDVFFAVQYI